MADRRNVEELWAMLLEGEPEVDESIEITSSMVNQQTMQRILEDIQENNSPHDN